MQNPDTKFEQIGALEFCIWVIRSTMNGLFLELPQHAGRQFSNTDMMFKIGGHA
jgi:hypothetical protein